MKFSWAYAVKKLFVFLTSTKSLSTLAGWLVIYTQIDLTPEWQAVITLVATFLLALWKHLDSIYDMGVLAD